MLSMVRLHFHIKIDTKKQCMLDEVEGQSLIMILSYVKTGILALVTVRLVIGHHWCMIFRRNDMLCNCFV